MNSKHDQLSQDWEKLLVLRQLSTSHREHLSQLHAAETLVND